MDQTKLVHDIAMYFEPGLVERFAALEQNEKNYQVARVMDRIIQVETEAMLNPLTVAELGGGAHPDRYVWLFERLMSKPQGVIEWVDLSLPMLDQARKYLEMGEFSKRKRVIKFVNQEILTYLEKTKDEHLDLAIMKYTFDHIEDIEELFLGLSQKLKKGGVFVANLTSLNPRLKSASTNARFLYRGRIIPANEVRKLKSGEAFGVQYVNISGKHEAGYMPKAKVTKYYFSETTIRQLATKYGYKIFLGDWKRKTEYQIEELANLDLDVLVLRK